jgi:hypothetical protein
MGGLPWSAASTSSRYRKERTGGHGWPIVVASRRLRRIKDGPAARGSSVDRPMVRYSPRQPLGGHPTRVSAIPVIWFS